MDRVGEEKREGISLEKRNWNTGILEYWNNGMME